MKTITKIPNKHDYHRVIMQTQYEENYGAHDWDGQFSCPQYWKFKGGYEHLVAFFPAHLLGVAESTVNKLNRLLKQAPSKIFHFGDRNYESPRWDERGIGDRNVSGIMDFLRYVKQVSPRNFLFPDDAFVCDEYSREYPVGFDLVEAGQFSPDEKRDNEMNHDGYSTIRWVVDVEPVLISA
jgi:hypothetical protein